MTLYFLLVVKELSQKTSWPGNGFTLIEVLVVLLIWSALILFIIPMNFSYVEKKQEEYFFETLAFDVLYTQSLSTTTKDHIQINIYNDRYVIRRGHTSKALITRTIPTGWKLRPNTYDTIIFDPNGRIRAPGTFIVETNHHKYAVVFPFGKGRYHVVEQ